MPRAPTAPTSKARFLLELGVARDALSMLGARAGSNCVRGIGGALAGTLTSGSVRVAGSTGAVYGAVSSCTVKDDGGAGAPVRYGDRGCVYADSGTVR